MIDREAVRRTATVLLLYGGGAWLVFLLGGWLRRVLALPPLFDDLLTWGVYGGAVFAALLAWFYPSIASGHADAGGQVDSTGQGANRRGRDVHGPSGR